MYFINKLLVLGVLASAWSVSANTLEYVDTGTIDTAGIPMHYCGVGLMSGLHVRDGKLLCNILEVNGSGLYNWHTRRHGMQACPQGTAMSGIHVKQGVVKCNIPQAGKKIDIDSEYVNYDGYRYGMHACPEGWVMTGVHVKNTQSLCSKIVNSGSYYN